jgi:tetratricopeptide (TPR) repeat protein
MVIWRRRWPEATFALGWFVLALAPVLDLFPLGPRAVNMADRYLFIPSLGICWLLTLSGIRLWDHGLGRSRRMAVASTVAVAGLLLAWTGAALGYSAAWRDNIALFSRMVRDLPESSLGYQNLGLALARAGQIEEAIPVLETAVRLNPGDIRSQLSLARTYVESGRTVEGFRILDRMEPRARHDKMYYMVRARAHMAVQEWEAAFQTVSQGLQQFPNLSEAYQVLGFVQEQRGRAQDARDAYRRAVELRPDLFWSHLGLAHVQLQLGRLSEAASAARAAVDLDADSVAAWRILARVLEQSGDLKSSHEAQERVLELERTTQGNTDVSPSLLAPGTSQGR